MDRATRNAIVEENLPLVGYLVSDAIRRATHLSREDLVSVGTLALISAVEAFNPDLGVPFGAYARQRIVGALLDDMRASDWATRGVRSRIRQTTAAQDALAMDLGRTPSRAELAAALDVDAATVDATLAEAARSVQPLDDLLTDTLADGSSSPQEQVLTREQSEYVRAGVRLLPERMRYITEQIYFHDRSVNDLAAELGISHSAVSQQRSEAVQMLRQAMAVHYGDQLPTEAHAAPGSARRRAFMTEFAALTAGGFTRPDTVVAAS
ncbi:sigma-70 family RNA polymerase sigma factor [Pseudactinotalea terrae]|uniref:sigma-70 family RNA polymerase sigma factor n=1 Tax=Pseudactinotalea terrae TaxID=1743262 RepID=UPI0012E2E101|nr:sigma-70 family RNA polymerase sigma factor [Pseudactinotalea terrae]